MSDKQEEDGYAAIQPSHLVLDKSRGAMNQDREFAAMADSCIAAQVAIKRSGTPEMTTLIRILLFQICQELARRESERKAAR